MKNFIIILLSISSVLLGVLYFNTNKKLHKQEDLIKSEQIAQGQTVEIYADADIKELKKINRELYDSIKAYKDELDYLIQFKYKKTYKTDTVFIKENKEDKEIKIFNYSNNTDTLNYNLTIGSETEPNWYKLDFDINENFTIVNRNINEINKTTITTENAIVDNVTIVKTKKRKFIDRFHIGPSVTAGYSLLDNKFDVTVGIGITYDLK